MTITLSQVAKASGYSLPTVSQILNSKGRFPKQTRDLVLKKARELGYRPNALAQALVGIDVSPIAFLLGVNVLLLLLGCVLDATTIILVIIPLFLPTCRELGIDLVHFGVVAVVNCMIGLITPPYGILLFVINAVTRIPLAEIIRELGPFLAVLILALLTLIVFPDLVLWLPRVFGYAG